MLEGPCWERKGMVEYEQCVGIVGAGSVGGGGGSGGSRCCNGEKGENWGWKNRRGGRIMFVISLLVKIRHYSYQ